MNPGLVFDIVAIAVLAATLVFLVRLSRRLADLRADRDRLEAVVLRFSFATEQAQRGMSALKAAAASTGTSLQAQIDRAAALGEDLGFLVERANGAATRLETAVANARPRPAVAAVGSPPQGGAEAPSGEAAQLLRALGGMR